MNDERLFCRVCQGEVGLVRINAEILTLGHKVQPKDRHHYVRLARTRLASPGVGDGAELEGPAMRREDDVDSGLSPDPALPREPRGALRVHAGSPALSRGARPLTPCGDVALGGNHRAPRLSAGRA